MKKRTVCAKNIHKVNLYKPVLLVSEAECSFEKYAARQPMHKIALGFKYLSEEITHGLENPFYDPHGFTIRDLFIDNVIKFLNTIHPDYSKTMLKEILEKVK